MPIPRGFNFKDFQGTLPYASELFGVYQPLLGWRSNQTAQRVDDERRNLVSEMLGQMMVDPRFRDTKAKPRVTGPGAPVDPVPPDALKTRVAQYVANEIKTVINAEKRPPTLEEWKVILEPGKLAKVLRQLPEPGVSADSRGIGMRLPGRLSARLSGSARGEVVLASEAGEDRQMSISHTQESLTAGTLSWLATHAPDILGGLFLAKKRPWEIILPFIDPLANFDPEVMQAVLSPVGMVHLYREYFFEFETFLGSPVGHTWISPGGTVELIEVNTRRTLTERFVEIIRETTAKSELASINQDELADAVKEENQRDVKLGVTSSAGTDLGVFQGNASANFGLNTTHHLAEETTHKRMRQQSEKLTSEIRNNFHMTFRTTTDVTDTSSRRYTIQNTSDKLVNYELRRKMRRVGVQVQHVGTQMCWQVFVDDPGNDLGVAELVHAAQPGDVEAGVQPPDAPVLLGPKEADFAALVPFQGIGDNDDKDELYIDSREDGDPGGGQIKIDWYFDAPPPGPGYYLSSASMSSLEKVDPGEDLPEVSAEFTVAAAASNRFRITLHRVNYRNQPGLRFIVHLIWDPPDQAEVLEIYQKNLAAYDNAKNRAEHEEYIKAVRERIELASEVVARPASDLRQEERTVVYRRIIRQLMEVGDPQTVHLTSELIRALFDVDQMLYFVAPEWWRPRQHLHQHIGAPPADDGAISLTDDDKISWGGVGDPGRDNYLITDQSSPARLGSSLGWLLQLDGDDRRNAFLNSPWVKAIVPIRPGREAAALNWLQLDHVEGTAGLDAAYGGPEPALQGKTVKQALQDLAGEIGNANTDIKNVLSSETVFENGFNPLDKGFRATGTPYEIFDQWVEVLPTDQVVAVEYDPKPHM